MKRYKHIFKDYLNDIAKKTAHPAGGSCAALNFCMGISLIKMALNYSGVTSKNVFTGLEKLSREVFPFIDEDGILFTLLIKEKDKNRRKILLERVQTLTYAIGDNCNKLVMDAHGMRAKIKKSLESDFYTGLKLIESALYASIQNLEANQHLFSIDNTQKISHLKAYLKKFKPWLR
jgi:formiminotetrahydrofolate cyclodeaminase